MIHVGAGGHIPEGRIEEAAIDRTISDEGPLRNAAERVGEQDEATGRGAGPVPPVGVGAGVPTRSGWRSRFAPPGPGAVGGLGVVGVRTGGAVAVVVALLAGVLWWGLPSGTDPGGEAMPVGSVERMPSAGAPAVTTTQTMTVHVSGAVSNPGLVMVPAGARIADVIAAAGGADRSADVASINLAAPVGDGEQIVVPAVDGDGGPAPNGGWSPAAPGTEPDGLIMLNHADAATLELLPGVGPVLAERIITHRETIGPFQTVEDLLDVSGIGEVKLAALRDYVVVP
ncbi:hypothetical protein BH24ACT7_BH24ACT7_15290 [soil metagenome]